MNNLIINTNGILVTTQDKVSVLTDNNEQSIQRLIRNNKQDLEEFGELNFYETKIKAGLGFTHKKTYYLNEQQATLLLTYMKNTQRVRTAKKILVKAFFEMKKELSNQIDIDAVPRRQVDEIINASNKLFAEFEKQKKELEDLKKQLVLREKDENPFKGFYTPDWTFRERENEYAYTRKDWMLLLNECERTLVAERQNRNHKQLIISKS